MEIFLAFEPIKEAASDFIKLRVKTFNQFHEKQKNATEIIMFIVVKGWPSLPKKRHQKCKCLIYIANFWP